VGAALAVVVVVVVWCCTSAKSVSDSCMRLTELSSKRT
jgi:hypothetical protein